MFDLLVIVSIASGLLGLAWALARERGRKEAAPLAASSTGPQLSEAPELQLRLPLEKFGMVLTREHVEGNSQQALAALDQRCTEVLAAADEWVLSLAVSPEEQQLLDSLIGTEPLAWDEDGERVVFRSAKGHPFAERKATLWQLFPLTQPTGRAGIRGVIPTSVPLTPALSPTVESLQNVTPNVGEREQEEQSPSDDSGSSAAAGRRLICWGFIVSDGGDGHTLWFARPREKLPRSVSQKGHAP